MHGVWGELTRAIGGFLRSQKVIGGYPGADWCCFAQARYPSPSCINRICDHAVAGAKSSGFSGIAVKIV